jgi:hypothetical protein
VTGRISAFLRGRPGRRGRAVVAAVRAAIDGALVRLYERRSVWVVFYFAALTPLLFVPRWGPALPPVAVGTPAPRNLVAPATFEYIDHATTRSLRQAAGEAVHPVFDFDSRAAGTAAAAVRAAFRAWRNGEEGAAPAVPPRSLDWLRARGFDPAIEERLVGALRAALARRVVGSRSLLPRSGLVTLRDAHDGHEWREASLADVLTVDEARAAAFAALAGAGPAERAAVAPLIQDLVAATLTANNTLFEVRRGEAIERVEPLRVRIPRGRILVRAGEVVTEETTRRLEGLEAERRFVAGAPAVAGRVLIAALLLFFMARYVFFYQTTWRRERHLFALMVVVTVAGLAMDRGFLWICERIVDSLHSDPYTNLDFYHYMMPTAAGAVLMTLLASPRVGMAYALFHVPLFGMMFHWDLPLLLFGLISNLAGIYGVTTYRERTALIKAGLLLGAVNGAAVLAIHSIFGGEALADHPVFLVACAVGGGILVTVTVSFLLPLLESAFDILTDVRLLELSNVNNPLLRRLAVEAPGSYNHSVIVGTLAEAAAEAIGANALFCRVAAYYHDVGKMLKPAYFVENNKDGSNRHDRLSAHLSALIIASHVKEGYELARSYGLPRQVLEIIPQHHGTRRINFFYEKARRSADGQAPDVPESDFRYPGPKPQTREAAIFMLSDSIEAAARTLEAPSPARFKGLIRTIISDVVLDNQFDECDLTFADLDKASTAFLRTLSSIYHHRIDYPGFDFEKTPERAFHGSRTHVSRPAAAR